MLPQGQVWVDSCVHVAIPVILLVVIGTSKELGWGLYQPSRLTNRNIWRLISFDSGIWGLLTSICRPPVQSDSKWTDDEAHEQSHHHAKQKLWGLRNEDNEEASYNICKINEGDKLWILSTNTISISLSNINIDIKSFLNIWRILKHKKIITPRGGVWKEMTKKSTQWKWKSESQKKWGMV